MPETESPPPARDYVAIATAFAKEAAADKGGKKHCKWIRLAAKRHLADLARKDFAFRFSDWHATDICDFIEKLPHVAGNWTTANITLEPPQIFCLAVIFGWRRKDNGLRRFTSVYIEMARKGAKSTLTAGVALYCLCCENEVGPEIVIGATTGEQAGKVFQPAKRMVERTPALADAFDLKALARSIVCEQNGGFIQPINAKGKTQDGWNPHLGILDELHAHKDRSLYDVIKSAFGSRSNPLLWVITTAGYDTGGVCYEQRTLLTKVLEGVVTADHMFGAIFTVDDGDDPFDPKVWVKANPMLGVTPKLEDMKSYAIEAKASPASQGEFKTKRLNLWLNAANQWLNMAQWMACSDPSLDWKDFEGLDCWVGADLADKDDITAAVLAAFDNDGRLIWKPKFWLPEAVLKSPAHSQGTGAAPYRAWHDKRLLTLTPGDWVDHGEVEKVIRDWFDRFAVRHATFDQFAAAQKMAVDLNNDLGSTDRPVASVLQKNAANVTDPAKELEKRIKVGPAKVRHDGNEVMNWMASNVVIVQRRDETILPIKESKDSANKIDGIDALINAIAPAMAAGESSAPISPWDDPNFSLVN